MPPVRAPTASAPTRSSTARTAGLYAPGSTFKVLTASAAIDSGRFKPTRASSTPATARSTASASTTTTPRRRSAGSTCATALKHSVNSVFCNIGKELGAKKLVEYMKRFGFYSTPPLETPSNERAPSGLYQENELFDPKEDTDVDPGRFAFGQERLLVTPLQMAMLAATVANDGVVMRPVRRRPDRGAGRLDRRPHEAAGVSAERSSRRRPRRSRR